jgi:hypothetical protein
MTETLIDEIVQKAVMRSHQRKEKTMTENQGPCKRCGHVWADHAVDINYPDAQRCFYRAATGEGCALSYDDRCRDYLAPTEAPIAK